MSLHTYKQLLMNLKCGWSKSFAGFACSLTVSLHVNEKQSNAKITSTSSFVYG